MSNETTTTSLNDFVDTLIADALMQLIKVGVMPPKVDVKSLVGFPGKAVNFTKWDAIASSDVGSGTEGTAYTTNKQLASSVVAASVDEHLIRSAITDLAEDGTIENVEQGAGVLLGNAMSAKLDDDLVGLFGGFDQTVAGAGTTLLLDHIFQAISLLRVANAPGPYWGVFHPKQIWGPKGFSGILDASSVSSNAQPTSIAYRMQQTWELSTIAGLGIDWSTEIDPDVASGGDAAAGIFSQLAIGLAQKGLLNVMTDFDIDLRGFILLIQGLWKEVEVVDTYGVYCLSDVA